MSLFAPYDKDNVFARILRGELPCHQVFEDDVAIGFMDLFPQAPGHMLVVPKAPCANLLSLPADQLGPVLARVQAAALAVQKAFQADGVTMLQFNGVAGGQTVFHLHFHVIPRHDNIAMKGHGSATKADDVDLRRQASAIAAHFTSPS